MFIKNQSAEADLTEKEKVALEYTDRIMAYHGVIPEELMIELKRFFTESEIVALTVFIGLMNTANWFSIAMNIEE